MRIDKYQNIPTSWYSSAAPFPSLHISTNGGSFSSRVVIQHDRTNTHQQHTPCSKWWSLLLFFFRLLFSLLYIDITLVSLMVMELFYRYFHLHHAQCNYEIPATFIVQCTMPNRTVPPHEVIIYPQQKKCFRRNGTGADVLKPSLPRHNGRHFCIRHQAIIWTKAYPMHWRIYAALRGDELMSAKILPTATWNRSSE